MLKTKLQKQRIGKIGEIVLASVAVVGVVSIAVLAPNMLQILVPLFKKKKHSPKQSIHRNIDSLIRSGLLHRTIDKHGEVSLRLTEKGRWEVAIRHQTNAHVENKKWDGFWRVVVFDIPNTRGSVRSELRRGMKLFGFKQLQRSVWVYPYACDDFVALLKSHLGVSEDVLVMEVAAIENDKHLRTEFKL